jgi:hypothetical protein
MNGSSLLAMEAHLCETIMKKTNARKLIINWQLLHVWKSGF